METALPPMEKWFPQGHEPGASDDFRTFYYISSFRSLDNLPDEVRGKAAVEILFPSQPAKTGSEINVRLLILETRSHSGKWIAPITPEVNKSAQVLLDSFMADLDAEAKKR